MQRIVLTKYGFVRTPEKDFTDDGNHFTCYRVGKVVVSKLVADGAAYISGYMDGELPYEVYSKLPHYSELDRLNGVPVSAVNEESIQRLYEACISYEKEYGDALSKIVYPTFEELQSHANKLNATYHKLISEIENEVKEKVAKMLLGGSDYDFKHLRDYYSNLTRQIITQDFLVAMLNTSRSISWLTTDVYTWYYQQCKEILAKY